MNTMVLFRFLPFSFAISFGLCSWGQNANRDDVICWMQEVNLEWKDFAGRPDTTGEFAGKSAATATHIQSSAYWDKGLPNFRVSHVFDRSKSWTLDTTSMLLLNHERLHFEISELFARKIRRGIEELRAKGIKDMDQYTKFIEQKLKEMDDLNSSYDDKTWNGAVNFLQEQWDAKIKRELELLKKYTTTPEDCKVNAP